MADSNVIPAQIQSYVFLDLETTGLPHERPRPKVTEIALVSAQRTEIINKSRSIDRNSVSLTNLLPRVVNKMNICVHPNGVTLSDRITEITGLSNENLRDQETFDMDVYDNILWFIGRLRKPVCILAHNGHAFDFQILQSEFTNLGQNLPTNVYYADTLDCFRGLLKGLGNYRLSTVYETLMNRQLENAHRAETDAVALLECAVVLGDAFVQWTDNSGQARLY